MTDQPTNTAAIKALCEAQAEMPKAIKDSRNPHFNKTYESLAAVQDACLPHLHASGFAVTHHTERDGDGWNLVTILMHESGHSFSCCIPLIVDKNNMQGFKSAVTYARRIGLGCLSGVAPEDDDGNNAAANPPKRSNGSRDINDTPPPDENPFRSDNPDYDPKAAADRLLDELQHTADSDLKDWKASRLDEMNRLYAEARAEFDRVVDACRSRAKQNETEPEE